MAKYLVLKGCAGLGNRFITLMKALQYARLSKRKVYVDWADGMFGAVGHNVFEEYFELNNTNRTTFDEVVTAYKCGASTYPRNLVEKDFYSPIYPESSEESSFIVYTPQIARKTWYKVGLSLIPLHKTVYLFGLQSFQRPKKMEEMNWWKLVRTMSDGDNLPLGSNLWPWLKEDIVFFADFRPFISMKNFTKTVALKPKYQEMIEQKAEELNIANAVGVHIRYTDKKPTGSLEKLIQRLEEHIKSGHGIFLCTDNKDIEEDFRERFGKYVITTDKYIPKIEKGGIHIWASKLQDGEMKKRMFEDSLVDMWLLSKCQTLYWQGNSSFSYISKLLNGNKNVCIDWTRL